MKEFLCATIECMVLLPGMLCAYLPMKQYLRMRPLRLAAFMVPLTLLLCLAGGALSYAFHVDPIWMLFPIAVIAAVIYVHTVRITRWKSISVFLAICASFSCLGSVAVAVSGILPYGNPAPPLSLGAAIIWFLMCSASVAMVWHPSTHAARKILDEGVFAQTWYVFWILPILFIGLNLAMIPIHPDILDIGRIRSLYILNSLSLLFLLLLFYALFYLMASSLNHNSRLRQENQFLAMQQARYDNLKTAIAQTREARHDIRHHFNILQHLAGQKEWEALAQYLSDVQNSLPDADLNLCDNTAVDSVASHYGLLYRKHNIPFSFELDLPENLPVPEPDLCLTMSNLLENALEASLKTDPAKRLIKVQVRLHLSHMVLLTVENTFDGDVSENDGVFLSSKRRGEGVGLQSVRHITEKNDGYCRFLYGNGTFCANIILRGKDVQSPKASTIE